MQINPYLTVFVLALTLLTAWPTTATPPYTAIVIDSGSPYFIPKSATVTSGAPIRWDNPTPTEHTITHMGCMEEGGACAFDSGIVTPNNSFTLPGLAPGQYPYFCRVHPIMRGTIIVTDAAPMPSQL
ncbi:cupredoxin domain-containing protein [Petrachloros mirabilis]